MTSELGELRVMGWLGGNYRTQSHSTGSYTDMLKSEEEKGLYLLFFKGLMDKRYPPTAITSTT